MRNITLIPKLPKCGQLISYGTRCNNLGGFVPREYYVVRMDRKYITVVNMEGRQTTISIAYPDYMVVLKDKFARAVFSEKRHDGYLHCGVVVGKRMSISAGCRSYTTIGLARKHWTNYQRTSWAYDKKRMDWTNTRGGRYVPTYSTPRATERRADDKRLNSFSLKFAAKVERARLKKS